MSRIQESIDLSRKIRSERKPLFLVVGECGDGKSSIINALTDGKKKVKVGNNPDGVTKKCKKYDIGWCEVIDTPGIGDGDVTVQQTITMLETMLSKELVQGVIITSKDYTRVKMGGSLVCRIVDLVFKGERKWDNVIFCFTHADLSYNQKLVENLSLVLDSFNKKVKGASASRIALTSCPNDGEYNLDELITHMESIIPKHGLGKWKSADSCKIAEIICSEMGIEDVKQMAESLTKLKQEAQKIEEQKRLAHEEKERIKQEIKESEEKLKKAKQDQERIHQEIKRKQEEAEREEERIRQENKRKQGQKHRRPINTHEYSDDDDIETKTSSTGYNTGSNVAKNIISIASRLVHPFLNRTIPEQNVPTYDPRVQYQLALQQQLLQQEILRRQMYPYMYYCYNQ